MAIYQRLTERVLASGVTSDNLIHIVITGDTSQDPNGSSYKAKISQVFDLFSPDFVNITGDTMTGALSAPTISATTYQNLPKDVFVTGGTYSTGTAMFTNNTGGTFSVSGFLSTFTGNTSATCITDLYVTNLNSCSPLHIQPVNSGNVFISENGGTVGIGTTAVDGIAPETLTLSAKSTTSYNIITAKSNVNNYAQLNIINKNYGASASADIVATNNLGNESTNFIDMGINGSNFSGAIGVGNDAYMYSTGRELYVGNASTGTTGNVRIFAGNNGVSPQIFISGTTGYVGINTSKPEYLFDVVNTNSRLYYDPTSVGGIFVISGKTNVPRLNAVVPPYLTKPQANVSLGMRAWDDLLYPDYGNPGDAHIYAGVNAYGLNIISEYGTTSEDYIRFYAGQDAYGTVPDIHIQGSGGTRGNVGIATASPKEKLHVSGNTLITGYLGLNNNNNPQYVLDAIGTQSRMYYDSESVGGRILLSGNTNVPRIGVAISSYLTKPTTGFELGMRTWNDATYPGYGKVGDAFFYAGVETNGFNVLNPTGTGTEDYIRFYAGQLANGNTPDMHIQGSGTTRGYIGIGTSVPTQKLHVSGNTIISSGLTASTLNISTTPTTDTGTTANYLTRDGVTGEIKVKTIPGPTVYGLFSQTGTSVAVSATTVETTLISGGVGSIIIPANGFSVGDSFHGVLIGHLSCVGTATLHIRIKTVSGILLAETGVMAMEASTNKHWKLDVNFTVRQVGVATVASIASGGLFAYTKNSGLNFEGVNFSLVENTTFNTTISNTLVVTAEWNTNNAGNSIYSEIFTLNKIY